MLKRFIKWCFEVKESSSQTVLKKSITGEPLLVIEHGSWHSYDIIRSTPKGTKGALLLNSIKMNFRAAKEQANKVLLGEFDNCLDKKAKLNIIQVVKTIVCDNKGRYGSFFPDKRGVLEVKTFKLTEEECIEFRALLLSAELSLMRLSSR